MAKLTPAKVRHIRQHIAEGRFTHAQLARYYGVTERTIYAIARHQTWRHVASADPTPDGRDPQTGFWGVTANQTRTRFNAWLRHEGRTYHLGVFRHPLRAAKAYDTKARQLGLPVELLNFPEEA